MSDRAQRFYLDHNASAPLRSCAREAMLGAIDLAGNPSSVHHEGRAARAVLERARRTIATLCGAGPDRLVFTSGASEAAATLLAPDWLDGEGTPRRFARLAVCDADHPALRSGGRFAPDRITRLPVDACGRLDVGALEDWLDEDGMPLVAVAVANGETGVVQDVADLAERVHRRDGLIVTDASQAPGRLALDAVFAMSDAVILSSHKLGGPKGIGAFVLRTPALCPQPLVTGGPQETRRRAGTPSPMLAAGFAAAFAEAATELAQALRMASLRDAFEIELLRRCDARVLGLGADRLPQTSAFQLRGQRAETVQIAADLAGIAVSAGAACQSGKVGRSDALAALAAAGAELDPDLGFTRASFGAAVQADALSRLLDVLATLSVRTNDSMHRAA